MKMTGNVVVTLSFTKGIETECENTEEGEQKLEVLAKAEQDKLLKNLDYAAADFDLDNTEMEVQDYEEEEE